MPPLPEPDADAQVHSSAMAEHIRRVICASGGWISFARFMEEALYAPSLGYYTAGSRKFGHAGDFVTAPEMTPLFGQALAVQVAEIMTQSAPRVIEVGAGTGKLAADLLCALHQRGCLPEQYAILDLSADLRERQQSSLAALPAELSGRVVWLDHLPERFSGVVLGNELIDAMPVHLVVWRADGVSERGVALTPEGSFVWRDREADGVLRVAAEELAAEYRLPPDYQSEIALAARAWAARWGEILEAGALVLLDYGFPQSEYYHPQRHGGTVMCHYRHHAHTDAFLWPGLQDITAHVDFTALIAAAYPAGLQLYGYTTQAHFLINCGILDRLAEVPAGGNEHVRAAGAVNKLLAPHEMGELFKVMVLGKNLQTPLKGFLSGDQSFRL